MISKPAQKQISDSAVFAVCLTLTLIGIIAFTLLQYLLPSSFHSIMGGDYAGFLFYSRHLGIPPGRCSSQAYVMSFRIILICLVGVHLVASRTALAIDPRHAKAILFILIGVNLLVAIFYPPVQSVDTFNYTALARISAYYRLNPYTHSSLVLVSRHDDVAPYLKLAFKSMYGPLWTVFSIGLTLLLRGPGLFAQILVYKILEGVSLLFAANAARLYCERRNPGYGIAALISIGLNPLCLLEGPGNGHNDVLMMCLSIVALERYDANRKEAAALYTGLAAAIKFVPFFVLPWIFVDSLRPTKRALTRKVVIMLALIVLPTCLFFIPFWDHGAALSALAQRSQGKREVLITKAKEPADSNPVLPQSQSAAHLLQLMWSERGVLGLYALLTVILLTRHRILRTPELRRIVYFLVGDSGYPAWLILWIVQATLQRYLVTSYWFSWYYTWAILPAACVWTKKGNPLFTATMGMALIDTLFYTF